MKKINDLLKMTDEELYVHYHEEEPALTSERVRDAYEALETAFEDYVAAESETSFARGFRYAVKLMKGGAV